MPESWKEESNASLRSLAGWLEDLAQRAQQLDDWTRAMEPPHVVWLPGLFNPMAFLTAVLQSWARLKGWSLDQTVLVAEVTRRSAAATTERPREGVFVHGLVREGASWDEKAGCLEEAKPKVNETALPGIHIRVRAVAAVWFGV